MPSAAIMPALLLLLLAAAAAAATATASGPASVPAPFVGVNASLISDGEWVRVSYGGVPFQERHGCWIGVVSPPDVPVHAVPPPGWPATAPFTATAMIKYAPCQDDPVFLTTGRGSRAFNLLSMREDVAFWMFYNGTEVPLPQVRSAPVAFADAARPRHVHLSRTQRPDQMRVSWGSADRAPATVRYGLVSGHLAMTAAAATTTYTREELCGTPANGSGWRDPGFLHSAVLGGLPAGATVYYTVGSAVSGRSEERFFRVPAAPGPHAPTSILVFADMGASEIDGARYHWGEPAAFETARYLTEAATSGPDGVGADLMYCVGDLSYATGYSAKWDLWMSVIDPMASRVPLMTALGNHERTQNGTGCAYFGDDSGGECGKPAEARFQMPTPGGNQSAGWWSLDQGSIHLVALNTELPLHNASRQYAWLAADLAAVNRTLTPWVVVTAHRPLYDGETYHHQDQIGAIEPLLMRHQVELALFGHVHYAQLTCPVYMGKCVAPERPGQYAAPVHAVIGNGGMGFSHRPAKVGPWSEFLDLEWGYSRLTAHNATHLELDFVYDPDNNVHHSTTIVRDYPRGAVGLA